MATNRSWLLLNTDQDHCEHDVHYIMVCDECDPPEPEEVLSPKTEAKVLELMQPAFRFDDAGLDVFDRFEEGFKLALEMDDKPHLDFLVGMYCSALLCLAEERNWFEESRRLEAIAIVKELLEDNWKK